MEAIKNIKEFIELLGFTSKNNIQYQKKYKLSNYTIKIDLKKAKIFYRSDEKTTVERIIDKQIQIGDKTTSYFDTKKDPIFQENFVVLEVVNRLLEKGYLPNDIHLERRYPSGRGVSGGKSDVCVYDKEGKSLMVIECKTWGAEFEKERQKMEQHGGQLFAYLANDQNTRFLVLYASRLNNKKEFEYENLIIQIKDREEDLKKSLKQIEEENIKLYRDANNKTELFEVWKEMFNLYFHFNGVFDEDANAYSLELKALKKKDLKPLDNSQGLFNKFAEILRHNNISDNANAFNKILSLFLCKIVDEEKNDNDILGFQVKEDEEYEHLIDRLQALYKKGMKKLNEEIVYYSEADLHKIIKLYPKQTPIEAVEEVFRELKYYTNNEFAFKEVHNKKLFYQNGRVLTEVVKLIQNYRFKYNSQQQVLGDFFELMLNHGVKQSEGQFFTPIPIVKYIILSLGFDELIKSKLEKDDDYILPKILDYACGAGHFLTESIEELQHILKRLDISKLSEEHQKKIKEYRKGTEWTKDYIFGIEKDYRLARTSQIACYINGDGDANILFGDGLENHDQLQLEKKKFDVVIANPPYSVSAFKNYLNVGKTNFSLFEHLTERSSEIEALFIERTKQVLADNGLAGIVLPSTILSNTGIYTKAREILLKHFEIKAITELGSKTFIATGTTTVILFLKRRNDDFLADRKYIAEDVFNGINIETEKRYIKEKRFVELFCEHREFDYKDYVRFLILEINDDLAKTEMFTEYKEAFDSSTEIKNLKKKAYFKNYTAEEKKEKLNKRFYNYCKKIEKEKFLYFMLCLSDADKEADKLEEYYKPQQTVIVKTGNDNNKQKEFLGYEFQGKKGSEGIKINNYGGKLFDPNNPTNSQKANSYIRNTIVNKTLSKIDEEQKENISLFTLLSLINFNNVEFDKKIKTKGEVEIQLNSQFQYQKVNTLVEIIGGLWTGKNPPYQKVKVIRNTNFADFGKIDYSDVAIIDVEEKQFSSRKLMKGDLIVEKSGGSETQAVGRIVLFDLEDENFSFSNFTNRLRIKEGSKITPNYLHIYLNFVYDQGYTFNIQNGASGLKNLDMNKYLKIKIPVPPLKIQQKIISEIEKIEQKETENLEKTEKLEQEIQTEFSQVVSGKKKVKLDKICISQSGGTPSRKVPEYWKNGTINWLRSEVCQNCYVYENQVKEKITELGLQKSSAKIFKKDTVLIALVGATIGRVAYLTFEATTNQNIAGLYPKDKKQLNSKFLFYALMNDFDKNFGDRKGKFTMANMSLIRNLAIGLPSISEQKKLISIIEKKEKAINKLKLNLENVKTEKEEVLIKYL
ncbi:MAG: N-6 DNA methylase [Alphaproteobacteria bacterium]